MADLQIICVDNTCMDNPICCNSGYFAGTDNTSISVGDTFDPRAGVTAYDEDDNSIPFVVIPDVVDTSQEGTYYVAYMAEGVSPVVRTITVVPTVAYAYIDSSNDEMHFFRDAKGKYTDKQVVGTKTYYTGFEETTSNSWSSDNTQNVTKVVFDDVISPISCYEWFELFRNLTEITNIDNLDTSSVTNMGYIFSDCSSLTTLDVSSWDTSSVTNMYGMFSGCTSLTTLDVSKWDTSSVTNMGYIFSNCSSLTTLDVSSWDTSSVTEISNMFQYCESLKTLDLSKWDTSSITAMAGMFNGCSALTTIYASALFVVEQVPLTSSTRMFRFCTKLVGGAGTTYNASYIDKTRAKIDGGTSDPGYFTAKSA